MFRIVVVGGGSAGWITASYLHEKLDCELTVVHDDKDEILDNTPISNFFLS